MRLQYKTAVAVTLFTGSFMAVDMAAEHFTSLREGMESREQAFLRNAERVSHLVDSLLRQEAEVAQAVALSQTLRDALRESGDRLARLDEAARRNELESLERRWQESPPADPFVRAPQTNPVARSLADLMASRPGVYGAIFATDRFGGLVAATGKTPTFTHAHHYWWRAAWADGAGFVTFDDRLLDGSGGDYALGL
ncbi:MAG: hypothetical protein HQK87_09165, partial [Nitrospinae bacterium]|nr:hypothetical protein [Nitrospinota bacterium]